MNEIDYDTTLTLLGQLREKLQRLEETDYITAYYKGYSASGMTLAEIQEATVELTEQILEIERYLEDDFAN